MFLALDKLFLTVFVLEILVKWYTDFLGFWGTGWNIFDFVIVTASILGPSECVSSCFFKNIIIYLCEALLELTSE